MGSKLPIWSGVPIDPKTCVVSTVTQSPVTKPVRILVKYHSSRPRVSTHQFTTCCPNVLTKRCCYPTAADVARSATDNCALRLARAKRQCMKRFRWNRLFTATVVASQQSLQRNHAALTFDGGSQSNGAFLSSAFQSGF